MSSRDLPSFLLMQNPIQGYDWGSHDSLTTLFGIPNPTGKPQAELWMGAHPNGCSEVTLVGSTQKLSAVIDTAPAAALGEATVTHFGSLPFLFKVLCAEKALSIQVHPSKAQAEAGFAKEEAAGIPIKAGNRNYKDPNHKPELVFALTAYQAMNGFRAIPAILALFERVKLAAIADLVAAFAANQNEAGLQHFFHKLLILQGARKEDALTGLLTYASAHQDEETFALITNLAAQYPGDVGLFSPLLLNVVTLQPGQAMFLDACTPHAYVRGTGLEIMANSDNVLRAGLTPKYIDVAELLDCTRCLPKPDDQILLAPRVEGAVQHFDEPVPDFTFSVYPAGEHGLTTASAEILFAIDGTVTLKQGDETLRLEKGQSAFVPAATGHYQLLAEGRVARAGNRC
ncbi:TPA: mannose-6-phosphate isomerase, class I [Aeromonas salmonicida]|uniref:mannose-6-phosphate isomerase n=2 Tax=Aeromonas salmonicida subsp. salmonicida TaxID=29491 RepID=A4SPX6_AERS4|nr:mannose-6-phosphate isomerase, class I [Aeromonas salmonicida]ABO90948.1 mannose-6-phosphate isomerase [Aeromonas salmonicida subsp. salmonicida A449]AYO63998.1 mannose-6-phosphate isomerase, class I [Aeromonas salmonicida subsp. salmonicida 01-B526]EHI53275.1 mannose-6-phosphate isomerase [Aeromonas salmonicida subsp. salmonicida 01-B526]EKP0239814.1 mannose-6-phosphate isomerase, class I [Aeromonas salmonicida]EKP0243922.1 mannose-6-phosphate isomerase, class I [Aeromonas salmonicida]